MIEKILQYEESHKEIDGVLHKLCKICEEWFPCDTNHFYKNKGSSDSLFPYCKTCHKKRSTKWIKANPEKYAKAMKKVDDTPERRKHHIENAKRQRESGYSKEWQQNNPDKLKDYRELYSNKAHKINKQEWDSCKEYFENTCAYCGLPLDKHFNRFAGELKLTDFHKEHVDYNGSDDLGNCIPSCKRCNTSKHTENMECWYSKQEFFSEEKLDKIHKWLNEDHIQYIQEHKPKGKYTRKETVHIENKSQLDI